MNKTILTGRLTKDVELRYTQSQKAIVRFTLAVDRRNKEKEADFISCVAFDKVAELMEKYLLKGAKIGIVGRIQTGSYDGNDGVKHYTTDVIVDDLEFLESKSAKPEEKTQGKKDEDGFVPVPDDVSDYNLPF
jgi:single-strand DNA-binding protein